MLTPGLVTITFRKFDRAKICAVAKKAGLPLLEWGGDIHVPPTDPDAARDAVRLTAEAGLAVDTYGSYYFCTDEEDPDPIAGAAAILGAKNVRVWAGRLGSAASDAENRRMVADNLRRLAARTAKEGRTVSTEFHQNTLTDRYESAVRLAEEVAADNFRLYWQPNQFMDDEYNLSAIRAVSPYLSNVHVFTWSGHDKFPLSDGERMWRQYLEIIREAPGDHGLFLEFVCDDTEDQLYRDAETLLGWLEKG
ncbi:MAG: sugar phosphate isomerase/epimerase [Clostridiales bacterium]|nr:sugar phosphate isomerase/epimerase [Clostridiales bacterium]